MILSEKDAVKDTEFNFFCDLLDEIEEESKPNLTRKATKKEVDELIDFIEGFDKWSLLDEDCRREVIKFLDYKSRCKLSFCSKMDYDVVQRLPYHVYSISISENSDEYFNYSDKPFDSVSVEVCFQSIRKDNFKLVFSQVGNDTLVQWLKYTNQKNLEKRSTLWKSANYREEAVNFAEKWLKICKYQVKELNVNMKNYPIESSEITFLPFCEIISVGTDNSDQFRWWLQKVPEELSRIELSNFNDESLIFPQELLSCSQIMKASYFRFWGIVEFTDQQFVNLKAKSMNFQCVNITEDGINQYLKKWINGNGIEGFKSILLWSNQNRNEERIIRGIDVRRWDDDFRREARGFCDDYERCCGIGTTYQISSLVNRFESLTLCISDDRVSIYATGKRIEWGGKPDTDYSIPH